MPRMGVLHTCSDNLSRSASASCAQLGKLTKYRGPVKRLPLGLHSWFVLQKGHRAIPRLKTPEAARSMGLEAAFQLQVCIYEKLAKSRTMVELVSHWLVGKD